MVTVIVRGKYRKKKCNHGHNMLELYNSFEKSLFTISKAVVDIKYKIVKISSWLVI